MKTLLILGARRMQIPAIRTAKEMSLKVVAADPQPDAPGFRLADDFVICDLADERMCFDIAKRHRIDGVITLAADYPLPMVARICEELALPGITSDVAIRATNKRVMRDVLSSKGVPCPVSLHATTLEQAIAAWQRIDGATIFKPTLSHGGRGITSLSRRATQREIADAFERAILATRGDGMLVEELIDGPEFSVEALTIDGRTQVIAVTDKLTTGHPYWVEIGHSQPSQCEQHDVDKLAAVARASVMALDINWSASHTEIKLGRHGPRVMEIGARLGGGFITSDLVPLSTGIDLIKGTIEVALGDTPYLEPQHNHGAAVRFLTAPPGILKSVSGIDRAKTQHGIEVVDVYSKPGDRVTPLIDASGRIGHVIATGIDARSAIQHAETARDLVTFVTEPRDDAEPTRGARK